MRGVYLTVLIMGALLGATIAVAFTVWRELAGVTLGLHGVLALLLGVGVTLALGIGLMRLAYYSHRQGYDDRAGYD